VLLFPDELAPFALQNRQGRSPFVIICDHAGRLLPRVVGKLGLAEAQRDALEVSKRRRFEEGDPYFVSLSKEWGQGVRAVFKALPEPQWK
jgi:hypothetical protein